MTDKTIPSALLLALLLAATAAPSFAQVCAPAHECGDVNESDDVTVSDALGVLRRSIGLSVELICSCTGGEECPAGGVTRTMQNKCWNPLDTQAPIDPIDCAGTGQDGDKQRGLTPAFLDNGNGTITDQRTTLTWEKLSNDGTINDYDNFSYLWSGAFQKVEDLNAMAFAGFTDWRVPQIRELATLVAYNAYNPAVPSLFNSNCMPGCSVTECSCTLPLDYWSSTTYEQTPQTAWHLDARTGETDPAGAKTSYKYVRAVRGGY